MNNKSIPLNEPYEMINQQLNLSNIFINIKNKEYQEHNTFDIEKNNSSKIIKYLKKSDDFESFLECKNIIINPNKSFFNINDYSINQYQTKAAMIQRLKKEKEENKEEEKEEEEVKEESTIEKQSHLGRKRKNSSMKGKHNKYSSDNLYRKIKSNLLDIVYDFINGKIIEIYKDIPKYDIKKDLLKKIRQDEIVNSDIKFNQNFLNKKLKEIFSVDISRKYKLDIGHNKNLIQKLLDDKDIERNKFFNKLFNLTFFDCLLHFRGTTNIPELNGIINFQQFKQNYLNDIDYIKSLDYYVMNYEIIIMNKRARKKRKKMYGIFI